MTWTNKYKKSIDCNNPKGFSQKAHCQARKLRQAGQETKSKPVNEANQFAIQGHQVHADSNGMKIYHGGELVHHIKGDFSNPTKMDRARVQRYVTNKIQSSPEYKAKRDSLLRKEEAPVNVVGGGQVAGLGVGDQGEPGVPPKKKKKVIPFKTFIRKPPQ